MGAPDDLLKLKKREHGAFGTRYISDTTARTGEWCEIVVTVAATFTTLTMEGSTGTWTGVAFPVGHVIRGKITAITLTSGSIQARNAEPQFATLTTSLVGANNDAALFATARSVMADAAGTIICAWGAHAESDRAARLRWLMLNEGWPVYVLKLNTGGSPAHPLYLPGDVVATEWDFV